MPAHNATSKRVVHSADGCSEMGQPQLARTREWTGHTSQPSPLNHQLLPSPPFILRKLQQDGKNAALVTFLCVEWTTCQIILVKRF